VEKFYRISQITKRTLVFIGLIVLTYLAMGSIAFPEWFHSLLWDKGVVKAGYWKFGLRYWTDDHPGLLMVGVFAAIAIVTIVTRYRQPVFVFVDRFANILLVATGAGIIITAVLVKEYANPFPFFDADLGQVDVFTSALKQFQLLVLPAHSIESPIDFHYLEAERVTALFNQIEPELVEQQRVVNRGTNVTGKLGVSSGPVEAEVGGSKQDSSSSTYQHISSSPQRQCVELMNFLISQNKVKYYTSAEDWFKQSASMEFQHTFEQILDQARSEKTDQTPPRNKTNAELVADMQNYQDKLLAELKALQGLVIVDGEFAIGQAQQDHLTLSEKFSEKPVRIVFQAIAPVSIESSRLMPGNKFKLRVFGTVLHSLDDTGGVEIRPIAVF
jgi:hypothetical protein